MNIDAGAGNDSVLGSAGADSIQGGAGNDLIAGGSANDMLSGDVGDRLTGGTGQDILTGGAGADSFVLLEADSGDIITDFQLTLDNGRTLDQLDVLDLVDGEGNPIRTWQIQIVENGNGHAVLTFPGGETLTLQGIAPATLQTSGTLYSMGVPCFVAGMLIDCPNGPRPVQDLRPGDLVLTEDHGPLAVQWAGASTLGTRDMQVRPTLAPILIPAGSAAGNWADVLLSPQHAVALPGHERLIRARHLLGLIPGVRVAQGKKSVDYHHILLDHHGILTCHGLRCESLYPGPMTERMFDLAQRLSLSLAIARIAGTTVVPPGGLAALYGPRCRPLAPRQTVIRPWAQRDQQMSRRLA